MELHLEGKIALVTGSSKGIGAGIARGLSREGATVIVHGRDVDQTRGVAKQIEAAGGKAHVVTGDLTDSAGGADNGAPGIRPNYHDAYYAAFVIDPDGNNVEAVFQGRE